MLRRVGAALLVPAAILALAFAGAGIVRAGTDGRAARLLAEGWNPYPVTLRRPQAAPLSAMAELGRKLFYDTGLSGSGRLSCASCHDPANHYGPPPGTGPAMMGGADLTKQGVRAVPSLAYLDTEPSFSIGPDTDEDDGAPSLASRIAAATGPRPRKVAGAGPTGAMVPQGGLFWDGRADTLQEQALGPLLNPIEMDAGSIAAVADRLRSGRYAKDFVQLFGPAVLGDTGLLVSEAMFAIARYQIEAPDFHPYTSKFDYWLEGKARFTPAELHGYRLFNAPARANCAGCHVDDVSRDGIPPLFTDHQFEALAPPRNPALAVNRDPAYFDLGLCGPLRTDLARQTQYCAMFLTPTLRNAATRHAFFHNGVFTSLKQVMDFYDFRDIDPGRLYPHAADGTVLAYDDVPPAWRANIDHEDAPFDRKPGRKPAMSAADEQDIIAFLGTLTDGWKPPE
jgi:cytochrome c peroxidase